MSKPLQLKAYAKVNLSLDIVGIKDNGYHEVRMIMQTIKLFDRLSMQKNATGDIKLTTSLPYLPVNEKNLVYRAIDLIRREYGITEGVTAHLTKHIPVAAGMAGGSTDAAAALVGMNQLFALGISQKTLMEYGASLGADIPFCIARGTALSEGIGEILTPLPPIPDCFFLIIKPVFSCSTKAIYEKFDLQDFSTVKHPDTDGMIKAIEDKDLDGILSRMGNVLEPATGDHFEDITLIKQRLLDAGAEGALMSGSGSTVFGVFRSQEAAEQASLTFMNDPSIRQVNVVRPFNKIQTPYKKRTTKRG